MTDDLEGQEFTVGAETYIFGPKVTAEDFGTVPDLPPELVVEWDRRTPDWDITIGEWTVRDDPGQSPDTQ